MSSLRFSAMSFGLVLLVLVAFAMLTPRPIDWSRTFAKSDKIPFGCSLLYELLPDLFPAHSLSTASQSFYEEYGTHLESGRDLYMSIGSSFRPDEQSLKRFLHFIDNGGVAFIAAEHFSSGISDSLGFNLDWTWKDTVAISLLHRSLSLARYRVPEHWAGTAFDSIPSANCSVLGMDSCDKFVHPNYICIRRGAGAVYLHTNPELFTNYVCSDADLQPYVFDALSFLPSRNIRWDEYYKSGNHSEGSSLRVIFKDARLRMAYYIVIVLGLIFLVFHTKRRQRIVPIMTAPRNATLDFVHTVGRLYYEHRDSKAMIEKMSLYFQDYVRSHYYVSDPHFSESTIARLAAKRNQPVEQLRDVLTHMKHIQSKQFPEDSDVLLLQHYIQEFKEWKA